ncbi:YhzD family protein [Desertibacillus haloalkaliphilus]|uniref:YhzD family protein n=1 Tax=Desertibacillus haloalkaliphilus TaxID=1328930 RepID=UPI001C257517|nr:YhzD family protein [Desertibacillus haloalkaliphilus]MBU8905434.1 hypothetical protein [Desertibacillus haloalkaliphilus]
MNQYTLTVYDPSGEKLLEETIEAENDDKAKELCEQRLADENYSNHTSRMTRSGKLVHFHR